MDKKKELESIIKPLILRLDAIIRLIIETNKGKDGYNDAKFSRLLHSMGISPTEIAKILGKKKASDVSPYLYSKKKK